MTSYLLWVCILMRLDFPVKLHNSKICKPCHYLSCYNNMNAGSEEHHMMYFTCGNIITSVTYMQGGKRVVMVDSLSRFSEFIDSSELNLPSSTIAFEEEGRVSM